MKYSVEEMDDISESMKDTYIIEQANKIIKNIEDDIEVNLKIDSKYKYGFIIVDHTLKYLSEILEFVKNDVVKKGFKFQYCEYRKPKGILNKLINKEEFAEILVTWGECNKLNLEKFKRK